jgi:hypothetical protein
VAKCGSQPIEAIATTDRSLNSSFFIVARRWGWRHDFPGQWNSVLGVFGKQRMQERGTAAGQTNDEEGFANFLPRDARIYLPISLHEQTRRQYADEIGPKHNSSDQVELGLALAGIQQS